MALISLKWFGGMAPRQGEQHLPAPHATDAQNTNLYSGELRPLLKPTKFHTFSKPSLNEYFPLPPCETCKIYKCDALEKALIDVLTPVGGGAWILDDASTPFKALVGNTDLTFFSSPNVEDPVTWIDTCTTSLGASVNALTGGRANNNTLISSVNGVMGAWMLAGNGDVLRVIDVDFRNNNQVALTQGGTAIYFQVNSTLNAFQTQRPVEGAHVSIRWTLDDTSDAWTADLFFDFVYQESLSGTEVGDWTVSGPALRLGSTGGNGVTRAQYMMYSPTALSDADMKTLADAVAQNKEGYKDPDPRCVHDDCKQQSCTAYEDMLLTMNSNSESAYYPQVNGWDEVDGYDENNKPDRWWGVKLFDAWNDHDLTTRWDTFGSNGVQPTHPGIISDCGGTSFYYADMTGVSNVLTEANEEIPARTGRFHGTMSTVVKRVTGSNYQLLSRQAIGGWTHSITHHARGPEWTGLLAKSNGTDYVTRYWEDYTNKDLDSYNTLNLAMSWFEHAEFSTTIKLYLDWELIHTETIPYSVRDDQAWTRAYYTVFGGQFAKSHDFFLTYAISDGEVAQLKEAWDQNQSDYVDPNPDCGTGECIEFEPTDPTEPPFVTPPRPQPPTFPNWCTPADYTDEYKEWLDDRSLCVSPCYKLPFQGEVYKPGCVAPPPYCYGVSIQTQPQNQTIQTNTPAVFSVTPSFGSNPIQYQWYANNVLIAGAVNQTYEVTFSESKRSDVYTVVVSNPCGAELSSGARWVS